VLPLSLEGNIGAILGRILDVQWLAEMDMRRSATRSSNLSRAWSHSKHLPGTATDLQFPGIAKVIMEYASLLPDLVTSQE
jgi:hypothetical protein